MNKPTNTQKKAAHSQNQTRGLFRAEPFAEKPWWPILSKEFSRTANSGLHNLKLYQKYFEDSERIRSTFNQRLETEVKNRLKIFSRADHDIHQKVDVELLESRFSLSTDDESLENEKKFTTPEESTREAVHSLLKDTDGHLIHFNTLMRDKCTESNKQLIQRFGEFVQAVYPAAPRGDKTTRTYFPQYAKEAFDSMIATITLGSTLSTAEKNAKEFLKARKAKEAEEKLLLEVEDPEKLMKEIAKETFKELMKNQNRKSPKRKGNSRSVSSERNQNSSDGGKSPKGRSRSPTKRNNSPKPKPKCNHSYQDCRNHDNCYFHKKKKDSPKRGRSRSKSPNQGNGKGRKGKPNVSPKKGILKKKVSFENIPQNK